MDRRQQCEDVRRAGLLRRRQLAALQGHRVVTAAAAGLGEAETAASLASVVTTERRLESESRALTTGLLSGTSPACVGSPARGGLGEVAPSSQVKRGLPSPDGPG